MSRAVSAQPTPSHHEPRAWSHEGASATLRFAVSLALTAAYVAFAVWASSPWRAELRDAIGPVMAWVIPVFLAYVPAVLIGFMVFTLITLRYRVPHSRYAQRPMATGRVASRDGRGRRSKRGVRHRTDVGADRGPLLRRAAHDDPRRQQLDRPHRRSRRGDGAAAGADAATHLRAGRRESGGR